MMVLAFLAMVILFVESAINGEGWKAVLWYAGAGAVMWMASFNRLPFERPAIYTQMGCFGVLVGWALWPLRLPIVLLEWHRAKTNPERFEVPGHPRRYFSSHQDAVVAAGELAGNTARNAIVRDWGTRVQNGMPLEYEVWADGRFRPL